MKREDVDKELQTLMSRAKKAGELSTAGLGPALPLNEAERAGTLESVHILKERQREAERRFDEQLATKDQELDSLRARLRDLDVRLGAARREVQDREQETTAIVAQSRVWADEQVKVLQEMRSKHREEVARLREEEARLRTRVDEAVAERERAALDFKGREQGLQARVAGLEASREQLRKDLEAATAKLRSESEALREQSRKDLDASTSRLRSEADALRAELKGEREGTSERFTSEMEAASEKFQSELRRREAKLEEIAGLLDQERRGAEQRAQDFQRVVQETISKLLVEKTAHEELEEAQLRLEKDLASARAEAQRIQGAWSEDRTQWSELWERERSNREARRDELKRWEGELSREREALMRSLQQGKGPEESHETGRHRSGAGIAVEPRP